MTWNISTIVAEVFYCIIGLIFIATGMKALKDESCAHRTTTALFWFILAFTFIALTLSSKMDHRSVRCIFSHPYCI